MEISSFVRRRAVTSVSIAGLALAGLLNPADAKAVLSNANTASLYSMCAKLGSQAPNDNGCAHYIIGAFDQMSLSGEICPPDRDGVAGMAIVAGFEEIAARPNDWGRHPSTIIRDALKKAFPCAR